MIKIENVLFDFNGTIVDDLSLCLNLLNEMLALRNHPPVDLMRYLEIFDFPVIEYYKKAGFVFPKDNFDELANIFINNYRKLNYTCPLNEGVIEVLTTLKENNIHLSVVSASEINLLKDQLSYYGIIKYFDGISGLDNINAESKIESAKRYLKQSKYDLSKTIMIGDTLHDAEVAKELGVDCILVAHGHQSKYRLLQSGCIVVDNMLDVLKYIL